MLKTLLEAILPVRESQYSRGPKIKRCRNNLDKDRSRRLSRCRDVSLKLVELDVVVHVFAVLKVYLCCLCVMMKGDPNRKRKRKKSARRAGIPHPVDTANPEN